MTEDMVSVSLLSSCSFDLLGCCSRGQIQGWVRPVKEACFVVLRPGQHVRVLDSTYVFWTARMEIVGPVRGGERTVQQFIQSWAASEAYRSNSYEE